MDGTPRTANVYFRSLVYTTDRRLARECLSEFFGTFLFALVFHASLSSLKLAPSTRRIQGHDLFPLTFSAGITLMICSMMVFRITGGHLNPALSLLFALIGNLTLWKVPFYTMSQFTGWFFGAALSSIVYAETVHSHVIRLELQGFEGILDSDTREQYETGNATFNPQYWYTRDHQESTGHIYGTFPAGNHITWLGTSLAQGVAAGTLAGGLMAAADESGTRLPHSFLPLYWMFVVTGSVGTYLLDTAEGLPLFNPARDLGARALQSAIGYRNVWDVSCYWLFSGVLGPYVGFLAGGLIYQILIAMNRPPGTGDDLCPRCERAECVCAGTCRCPACILLAGNENEADVVLH